MSIPAGLGIYIRNERLTAIPNSTNEVLSFDPMIESFYRGTGLDNNHFEIRFMVFFAIKISLFLIFPVYYCYVVTLRYTGARFYLFLCSINNLNRVRLLSSLILA